MATQIEHTAESPLREQKNIDIEAGKTTGTVTTAATPTPTATATGKNANRRHERSCVQWWSILPITYKFFIILIFLSVLFISIIYIQKLFKHVHYINEENGRGNSTGRLVPPNPEVALPPSASHLHLFRNGAVCSDAEVCSQIGKEILDKTHNIIDAAIATLFCNGLVTMQSMGVGGGFVANIYKTDERKAYSVDARETAPKNAKEELFKTEKDTFKGPLSIAVPSEIKGYWEMYRRFNGTLPWKDLVQPSINLCKEGFIMSKHMSDFINPDQVNVTFFGKMLYNNQTGEPLKHGERVYPTKELCDTYTTIAEMGGDDFYKGNLAALVAEDLQELGSVVTKEDLENYKVLVTESLSVDINNNTVYFTPPPSGGIITAFILNILKGYNFTADAISTEEKTITTYHRFIEAFKFAFGKRTLIGDPTFVDLRELVANMTSSEYGELARQRINDTITFDTPEYYDAQYDVTTDHGTSHLSILGPNGDAISLTTSVNTYFGCGLLGRRTGIIFNNNMNDFSIGRFKNQFGLPASPANRLQPGKRSLSSMSPIIVTDKNKDVQIVIGAAGGTKIPTAISMIIARVLWFNQNIKEAVDVPRIHHQLMPRVTEYEYGNTQGLIASLERLGHKTKRYDIRGSIVCALYKNATGIYANADYRKAGEVVGL